MEREGAISPGILVLTTGLSKPFRRLDKYSAMLQELERYTEKNHPDRGDTQRSIAVYREIAVRTSNCTLNIIRLGIYIYVSVFETCPCTIYDIHCTLLRRTDVRLYGSNANWRFRC